MYLYYDLNLLTKLVSTKSGAFYNELKAYTSNRFSHGHLSVYPVRLLSIFTETVAKTIPNLGYVLAVYKHGFLLRMGKKSYVFLTAIINLETFLL